MFPGAQSISIITEMIFGKIEFKVLIVTICSAIFIAALYFWYQRFSDQIKRVVRKRPLAPSRPKTPPHFDKPLHPMRPRIQLGTRLSNALDEKAARYEKMRDYFPNLDSSWEPLFRYGDASFAFELLKTFDRHDQIMLLTLAIV